MLIQLSPSILSADFGNLERDIKLLEKAGATFVHVDVMDGHFVPNISIGMPVVKAIRPYFSGTMGVHLMITEPDRFIEQFKEAGADILVVHAEACPHLHRTIQAIKAAGMKAGVALNPATPVCAIEYVIDEVDLVLIMSVNPGFGGQSFIKSSLDKIRKVKQLVGQRDCLIEVDGGVNLENVKSIIEAGANVIVAGSAVFDVNDVENRIDEFKRIFSSC